ncbi:hypothetical protein RJ640_007785 [Escallonia rubra]|uniref:Nucleolar GTP-binding protein 2 N-terminal domain-containing protein n=1 Tax=Escallonia rubra TaxID=112253 RepID=A0AA88RVZ4_9ASTE|nr:hypothetical protein RJ640_007785 [Escallonia rubra]
MSTTAVISPPAICQYFWKNIADIPSGPGYFKGYMENKAECTSSEENGRQTRVHLLDREPFADAFGPKNKRKRPKLMASDYEELVKKADGSQDTFEEKYGASTSHEGSEDGFRDLVRHTMFEKGQSKRIWGELYKVIYSSDVVVQVGNMEVEIVSREIIKPSSQTPPHLRVFKLSLFDQIATVSYVPIVFFYPMNQGNYRITEISCRLKSSLSKALTRFYPLAGRIKDHVSIDCNDEGVPFLETRVNREMPQFLNQPNLEVMHQLLPHLPDPSEPEN